MPVLERTATLTCDKKPPSNHHFLLCQPTNSAAAYNTAGNIALFDVAAADLNDETGHSLDGLGAYPDRPLAPLTYLARELRSGLARPGPVLAAQPV